MLAAVESRGSRNQRTGDVTVAGYGEDHRRDDKEGSSYDGEEVL